MYTKRFRCKIFVLCIPGVVGFLLFYGIPFCKSICYSFTGDTYRKEFVWFENFERILKNQYFQLALKNTIVFSILGVAVLLSMSFFLAYGLSTIVKRAEVIKNVLVLPMFLPTISVISAWQVIFDNEVYYNWMKSGNGFVEVLPIYVLYIWKNVGLNITLITAAFSGLPEEVLEAAELDGARGWKRLRYIMLPLISPTLFFVGILSFVNSMKIFRESFLFYETGYPPDAAYTIQYYMNNHFQKVNYQNLSCASTIVAVLISVLIVIIYRKQNKLMKDVSL